MPSIDEGRWNAVFGAYVSLEVFQSMKEGRGYVDSKQMLVVVEDAISVADDAIKALQRTARDLDDL